MWWLDLFLLIIIYFNTFTSSYHLSHTTPPLPIHTPLTLPPLLPFNPFHVFWRVNRNALGGGGYQKNVRFPRGFQTPKGDFLKRKNIKSPRTKSWVRPWVLILSKYILHPTANTSINNVHPLLPFFSKWLKLENFFLIFYKIGFWWFFWIFIA